MPRSEKVGPVLVARIKDSDPKVVRNAIEALAELGPKVLKNVKAVLGDKGLRPYAVRLIQRLGPQAKSAVPELIAVLKQPAAGEDDELFQQRSAVRPGRHRPGRQLTRWPPLVGSLSPTTSRFAPVPPTP